MALIVYVIVAHFTSCLRASRCDIISGAFAKFRVTSYGSFSRGKEEKENAITSAIGCSLLLGEIAICINASHN